MNDGAEEYLRAVDKAGGKLFGPATVYVDPDPLDPGQAGKFTICGVCKVPLNRLIEHDADDNEIEDTVVWLHSQSYRNFDHDPVPIEGQRKDVQSACDFCGLVTQQEWVYVGGRVVIDRGNTTNSYGHSWSACADCSPLVKEADYLGLAARVLRVADVAHQPGVDKRAMVESWMESWTKFFPSIKTRYYVGPRREPTKLNPRLMPKLQLGLLRFWNSGERIELYTDPAHRNQTVSLPGIHVGNEDAFRVRYPKDMAVPRDVWKKHCDHIAAGVGVANLYWIAPNFTRLAIMAGKDLTKLSVQREDLPSTFGFMVFAEPIGEFERPNGTAAIRAVTWVLVPGGVWLNVYIQGEDGDPEVDVVEMRATLGWLACLNAGIGFRFGDDIDAPEEGEFDFIRTIFASWYLMAQPGVAESEPAPVDKKLARSYQREHHKPLPGVQLVDLRKRPRRKVAPTEHVGRQLTVRVFRKGHWKRQPYGPQRSLRKMIYVSDYIAGPADAPLKERRQVVHIVR